MTLHVRTPLTAAQLQDKELNEAGPGVLRASYTPPAGTAWCILGCTFAPAVTQANAEDDLPPLLEALDTYITSVMADRFWMPTPAENLVADTQFDLLCEYWLGGTEVFVGDGTQSYSQHGVNRLQNVPAAKNVGVYVLRLPTELDGPGRAALESAVEGVSGVANAEVLLSGAVPSNVTGAALSLVVRYRQEPVPAE